MILLICVPHLNEWQHEHSWAEEDSRGWGNTSDVWKNLRVFQFDFLKVDAERIEAIIDIFIVGVASYLIWKSR